ncbi:lipid IV(A) 3-deoxy-D-manno-octulosonic acid transferase [Porticoccaceae bacterium]|nr:lipid IV(A) 3-deoxy-D-manno-octulosonic acid transferase [Porticoccaceae bacterium]
MSLARFIYSVFFYCFLPAIGLRLLWRGLKSPNYLRRWPERLGFSQRLNTERSTIWLHAVSVGETLAAVPLVKSLQKQYPEYRLMVTCMTPTGSERIVSSFGDTVDHGYAPYDMPDSVARFLNRVQPRLLIIMETELWPNTIAACHKRNIPVLLANGRLSDKSAKAYRRINGLARPMMCQISQVAAQHKDDADRFSDLGVTDSALSVTGNIKFDLTISESLEQKAAALSADWRGRSRRPVILAASTHRGEDEIVLEGFKKIKERLGSALLVLVPRHPERFNQVADLCHKAGFSLNRRSEQLKEVQADILLGDTMGELMTFYGACDVAFVGGSLVPIGGHNIIEPAAWGVPVISGPHLFNFSEASQLLSDGGGMLICENPEQLAEQCIELITNADFQQQVGTASHQVAEANRGALSKLMMLIKDSI